MTLLMTITQCRAPTDCVQYFTGKAGNVKSYNFGGGQLIQSLTYQNCIRTEAGYCAIQWKESSTTSPDPFQVGTLARLEPMELPARFVDSLSSSRDYPRMVSTGSLTTPASRPSSRRSVAATLALRWTL